MTDKEQIEEMEKEIDLARERALLTAGSLNQGFGHWYAVALYNAGHRKIDFKNNQLKVVDGEIYVPLWQKERAIKRAKKLSWKVRQVRKETAKEILQDLYNEADGMNNKTVELSAYYIKNTLAKGYGVEIEE